MRDHEIPSLPKEREHVAPMMRSRGFAREEITRDGIVSASQEGIPNDPRKLAGNENPHA